MINPLKPVAIETFTAYRSRKRWAVTADVVIDLRPLVCKTITGLGPKWWVEDDRLHIYRGYTWNGVTGGITIRCFRLASLIHDIICTPVDGVYPVPSYTERHMVYWKVARAQGAPKIRTDLHLGVLMSLNWLLMGAHKMKKSLLLACILLTGCRTSELMSCRVILPDGTTGCGPVHVTVNQVTTARDIGGAAQGKTIDAGASLAASLAATLKDITAAQGDATSGGNTGDSTNEAKPEEAKPEEAKPEEVQEPEAP